MIGEGMKVRIVPSFADSDKFTPEERREASLTAVISYINWEHRYFTVEWNAFGKVYHESFKFSEIGRKVSVCG